MVRQCMGYIADTPDQVGADVAVVAWVLACVCCVYLHARRRPCLCTNAPIGLPPSGQPRCLPACLRLHACTAEALQL